MDDTGTFLDELPDEFYNDWREDYTNLREYGTKRNYRDPRNITRNHVYVRSGDTIRVEGVKVAFPVANGGVVAVEYSPFNDGRVVRKNVSVGRGFGIRGRVLINRGRVKKPDKNLIRVRFRENGSQN